MVLLHPPASPASGGGAYQVPGAVRRTAAVSGGVLWARHQSHPAGSPLHLPPWRGTDCVIKSYNAATGALRVSVKETESNPFEGAELRHPVGSRRQVAIAGKYGGQKNRPVLFESTGGSSSFLCGRGTYRCSSKYSWTRFWMRLAASSRPMSPEK